MTLPLALMVLPLLGAALVMLLPASRRQLAKVVTLVVSLATLGLAIALAVRFEPEGERFQFVTDWEWIPSIGSSFSLGVDGVALALILMTALLFPVVVLASWHEAEPSGRSIKGYFALLLSLLALVMGVFLATDVLLFYVFFEVMLVPMYFLIGAYGGQQRQYAAMKFFLYSLLGGLLMLAAVIGLFVAGNAELPGSTGTFSLATLSELSLDPGVQKALFLGFFVAFAIKAPLVPFHTWLPSAAAEAPIGVAVLLVGVLDKVGTYGMLRFLLALFPDASEYFAPMVIVLSLVGIFYGALLAIGQVDLKRLVAYTSIAHFGFITLGIFVFTSQGGTGSVTYMVNHAFATGALFLAVGLMISRRGSRLVGDFGGLAKAAPLIAGVTMVAGMASLALPGTGSFVSEFLVLQGTFTTDRVVAVIATLGIILAAVYVLWMIQRTLMGPMNPKLSGVRDLGLREAFAVVPLMALIIAIGVFPQPILDTVTPSVEATLSDMGQSDPPPVVVGDADAQGTESTP